VLGLPGGHEHVSLDFGRERKPKVGQRYLIIRLTNYLNFIPSAIGLLVGLIKSTNGPFSSPPTGQISRPLISWASIDETIPGAKKYSTNSITPIGNGVDPSKKGRVQGLFQTEPVGLAQGIS
jgi:hypothetical protein